MGMAHSPDHPGLTHGTFLLDATGKIVWESTDPEPYMELQTLVTRAKNLPKDASQSGSQIYTAIP